MNAGAYAAGVRLARDASPIYIGDASGNRVRASSWTWSDYYAYSIYAATGAYLDSPATSSEVTYSLQLASGYSGQTVYVNRAYGDSDLFQYGRGVSQITVMEIAE